MKQMRFGRTAGPVVVLAMTLVLAACGDQTSSSPKDNNAGSADAQPDDSAATESGSGTADALGDYVGPCSWASPTDLEAIFGQPVDAVGVKECRVFVEGESEESGIYHLKLDEDVELDESLQYFKENQADLGFAICDQESTRWKGMRLERRVTCPDGSEVGYSPVVWLEVDKGRVLTNLPFVADSEQAAQDASQKFVDIFKTLAKFGHGQPVINEVLPGSWLEIYNTGDRPVDVSGATLTGYDDWDDSLSGTMEIPTGSTIAAGARLVVDISALKGTTGEMPLIQLSDTDGRFLDVVDLSMVDAGKVSRRNGDGGTYCSFGSSAVTKGAPNPPHAESCD